MAENSVKEKEVKNLNKSIYKILLFTLKLLPYIIALCYLVYTLFFTFGIDLFFVGYLAHTSILSWLFLYLSSFVFKFCVRHRLPLYYTATNDSMLLLDYYLKFPIDTVTWAILNVGVAFVFILLFTYLKLKK